MHTVYTVRSGVKRIKSTARKMTNKFAVGVVASVATFGLVAGPVFAAASTVTVTPSNMNGWYIQNGTGGNVSFVNTVGALNSGAVQLSTTTDGDYTRFKNDINKKLSDITTLSYRTHQVSAPDKAKTIAATNLRLYVDNDNNGVYDDVLVYEPYYTAPVSPDGWQTWKITQTSGYWWSNSQLTYNGNPTNGAGDANNITLSDVIASYADSQVKSIGLGTGTSNNPWVVQADALMVNDTTYDFEKTQPKVTATNKDQCKNGAWKNLKDASGKTFKNQGDCVSYVATNGKNAASGPQKVTSVATGDVVLDNPGQTFQTLNFDAHDNGASVLDQGTVTYSNPSASLLYTAPLTCVNVSGNTAYFTYQIPSDASVAANTWIVWKVVDNGTSDTAGYAIATDRTAANALCEAGNASVTNYAITSGDIKVQ